jgi:predicted molibdopterin-dependent oxidoreductase YjgC
MPRKHLTIHVDGSPLAVPEGLSVAAALLAAGITTLRHAPRDGAPRGAFCLMGVCQECVCTIDGTRREACRVTVRDGLDVVTG